MGLSVAGAVTPRFLGIESRIKFTYEAEKLRSLHNSESSAQTSGITHSLWTPVSMGFARFAMFCPL